MVDVERVLRREHGIRPGEDNDFRLRNRQELLNTQQATTQVFSYLLASIAGVSLLVGGIGIMNIMLVSVTERTREIGIRKALGATRTNILMQFLVEAIVLCLVGGVLGIALGSSGAVALSRIAGWNTFISFGAIVLAVAAGCVLEPDRRTPLRVALQGPPQSLSCSSRGKAPLRAPASRSPVGVTEQRP